MQLRRKGSQSLSRIASLHHVQYKWIMIHEQWKELVGIGICVCLLLLAGRNTACRLVSDKYSELVPPSSFFYPRKEWEGQAVKGSGGFLKRHFALERREALGLTWNLVNNLEVKSVCCCSRNVSSCAGEAS